MREVDSGRHPEKMRLMLWITILCLSVNVVYCLLVRKRVIGQEKYKRHYICNLVTVTFNN